MRVGDAPLDDGSVHAHVHAIPMLYRYYTSDMQGIIWGEPDLAVTMQS